MSKIEIKENANIFRCPICNRRMKVLGLRSLVCKKNHSFDISKYGYVNLLQGSGTADYDKKMLASRNIICKSDFFKPMVEQISSIISEESQRVNLESLNILDAGCGEGSHLSQIINLINSGSANKAIGVGIDISKEGIQIASKDYPELIMCVADLANLPFDSKQFDFVLSILSPSNYGEFNRIIKDDGILIKVVPGSNYLKELRSLFYESTDKQTYSNEKVIEHFRSNYNILDTKEITYNAPMSKENLEHLIKMTPLSWRASSEKVQAALDAGIDSISVEFSIISGKKKKRK